MGERKGRRRRWRREREASAIDSVAKTPDPLMEIPHDSPCRHKDGVAMSSIF